MKVIFSDKARKLYQGLPPRIQKKFDKQLIFLRTDLHYPSLRTKKMQGLNRWEARIDKSYRFTFETIEDSIIVRTVGPHDEGLGKK